MRRDIIYSILLLLLVLAVGCSQGKKVTEAGTSPLPLAVQSSPLPSPISATAPTLPPTFPEPASGLGTVGGFFVFELDGSPIEGATAYLGAVDQVEGGFSIARLNVETAPKAITDGTGHFVFKDVPPERYALIYETPLDTFLARYPSGEDVVFEVEPGEITDLGVIHTPLLGQ